MANWQESIPQEWVEGMKNWVWAPPSPPHPHPPLPRKAGARDRRRVLYPRRTRKHHKFKDNEQC